MTFIEEYRALIKTVEDFDKSPVDLSILSYAELTELECSRLPLYHLRSKAYRERLRRCEIEERERKREQEQFKKRYGYYYPELDNFNALHLIKVEAYEKGMINSLFAYNNEEDARARIHELIPSITDEEIDEYRKA